MIEWNIMLALLVTKSAVLVEIINVNEQCNGRGMLLITHSLNLFDSDS